jgi:hypothetical protein
VEEEQSQNASVPWSLEDHIRGLESSRIGALLEPDLERLRQLHSAAYQLISPSGRSFSREQYLGLIESGRLRYRRWEPGPMEVRAGERMAIVRYEVTLQPGSREDPGSPLRCWHTDSYELHDGMWQAVWSQATEIKFGNP